MEFNESPCPPTDVEIKYNQNPTDLDSAKTYGKTNNREVVCNNAAYTESSDTCTNFSKLSQDVEKS